MYGSSDDEDGEGEEEEEEYRSHSWRVSHTDAAAAVDVLMRYFEQCQQASENDISLSAVCVWQHGNTLFFTALTD